VDSQAVLPTIPESVFEHRIDFDSHWIDKWVSPNPFIGILYSALQDWDVALTDFSFNNDAKTVGDVQLTVAVRRLNSIIRVGVDNLIFRSTNPDWEMADKLILLFERASAAIRGSVSSLIKKQESLIAFHVSPGSIDMREATSKLVNVTVLGDAKSFGVSVYRDDSSLLVERSLRYDGGIFIRINRSFAAEVALSDLALRLYDDEISILKLLGIAGLI
jgi:hypothetical protein